MTCQRQPTIVPAPIAGNLAAGSGPVKRAGYNLLRDSPSTMKIRPDQLAVFADRANAQFEHRLAAYLAQKHGNLIVYTKPALRRLRSIGVPELLPLVRHCIHRAKQWGMAWESSIAAFTVLMFINGPNFDQDPTVGAELQNPAVPADSLPDHLTKKIPELAWIRIRATYGRGWDEMSPADQDG